MNTAFNAVASGDNTTGHVISAVALGGGLSGIAVWLLQVAGSVWHINLNPPASAAQGITALSMLAASLLLQRLAK